MNDIENEIRDLLHQSEDNLDAATTHKLMQIRHSAIRQAQRKSFFQNPFAMFTGTALASALVMVLVISPGILNTQTSTPITQEMLSSEGQDLYENADFYLWLATQNSNLRG